MRASEERYLRKLLLGYALCRMAMQTGFLKKSGLIRSEANRIQISSLETTDLPAVRTARGWCFCSFRAFLAVRR